MASLNEKERPNVLFVVSHDISRDWFGCYGSNVHTPNIDALAAGGFLFPKHYCQMPLCGPSRANIFTGCRPDTTDRFDNHTYLPAFRERMGTEFATLPEYFKNQGYYTQALDDIMHVTDHTKSANWVITEEDRSDRASWSAPRWDPPLPQVPSWAPDDWTTAESMRIWVAEDSRNVMRRRAHVLRSQGLDLIRVAARAVVPPLGALAGALLGGCRSAEGERDREDECGAACHLPPPGCGPAQRKPRSGRRVVAASAPRVCAV